MERTLDRLQHFDPRSRAFGISTAVPQTIESRSWPSSLWLDQGEEGACVSFAWNGEAGATPVAIKGITDKLAQARYFDIQRADEWPGGAYPGADPYYEGTSVLAGAKVMHGLGYFKQYRWAFGIEEALRAISHEGPVVCGVSWLDSMFDPRSDATLDVSGSVAGGHAILARGVVLPRSGVAVVTTAISKKRLRIKSTEPVVRLRNSWSAKWGVDGEAFIRASDLERLLLDGGECCVPVGRTRP